MNKIKWNKKTKQNKVKVNSENKTLKVKNEMK